MNDINLMLTVTREQQVAIEEYCINSGLSISQYLIGLHNEFEARSLGRPNAHQGTVSDWMNDSKKNIEKKSDENEMVESEVTKKKKSSK